MENLFERTYDAKKRLIKKAAGREWMDGDYVNCQDLGVFLTNDEFDEYCKIVEIESEMESKYHEWQGIIDKCEDKLNLDWKD